MSYRDTAVQRQYARAMEQALAAHNQRRHGTREDPVPAWDTDPRAGPSSPPPVFVIPDPYALSQPPTPRAARFRDGEGPPPPPPKIVSTRDGRPLLAPPPILLPELAVGGDALPAPPSPIVEYFPAPLGGAPPPLPQALSPPDVVAPAPTREEGLSRSQKKRLKRKQNRALRLEESPALAPSAPQRNGQTTHPALLPPPVPIQPLDPPVPRMCGAEIVVGLRHRGATIDHRFTCPLTPFPHPNQPHMVRIPDEHGAEIFLGWYAPGE